MRLDNITLRRSIRSLIRHLHNHRNFYSLLTEYFFAVFLLQELFSCPHGK